MVRGESSWRAKGEEGNTGVTDRLWFPQVSTRPPELQVSGPRGLPGLITAGILLNDVFKLPSFELKSTPSLRFMMQLRRLRGKSQTFAHLWPRAQAERKAQDITKAGRAHRPKGFLEPPRVAHVPRNWAQG